MVAVGLDVSGLDPTFKGHAQRGIGRYVSELKRFLDDATPSDVSVSYFNHKELLTRGIAGRIVNAAPVGRTTLRQQLLYPLRLGRGHLKEVSFVHFPAHMDAPAWSRKPYILTVLDLIPLVLKDLYKANRSGVRFHFARWLEITSIRNAALLLAISEHTAKDIVNVLGIPRERIVVTPLGVDEKFFSVEAIRELRREGEPKTVAHGRNLRQRLGIPLKRPLLLYVGGHDERKNIDRLLEIGSEVVKQYSGAEQDDLPFLVLAGRIGSQAERERLAHSVVRHKMAPHALSVGYVPDEDLLTLYAESELFLFPSLYEGFGLPPLEAMAAGVPVVSSSASSLPEVVGDTGLLFNPVSTTEGASAVLSLLTNKEHARLLSERARERAKLFTWRHTGETTLDAYRVAGELLAASRGSYELRMVEGGN